MDTDPDGNRRSQSESFERPAHFDPWTQDCAVLDRIVDDSYAVWLVGSEEWEIVVRYDAQQPVYGTLEGLAVRDPCTEQLTIARQSILHKMERLRDSVVDGL